MSIKPSEHEKRTKLNWCNGSQHTICCIQHVSKWKLCECSKYKHLDSNFAAHFIHLPFGNLVLHLLHLFSLFCIRISSDFIAMLLRTKLNYKWNLAGGMKAFLCLLNSKMHKKPYCGLVTVAGVESLFFFSLNVFCCYFETRLLKCYEWTWRF